jgi:hypothetical protein
MKVLDSIVAELRRRVLGISVEEIQYTFEDVRKEIRAVRAELKVEIAALRQEMERLPPREDKPEGPEIPVAEA